MEYQELGFLPIFFSFSILQALFLSIVLLSQHSRGHASLLLGILLIVEAIGLTEQFLFNFNLIEKFPHFMWTSYPFEIMGPALIYFFTKSFFEEGFKFTSVHLLNLIPFALYVVLLFPAFVLPTENKIQIIENMEDSVWADSSLNIIYFILHYSVHFIYSIGTYLVLRRSWDKISLSTNRSVKWIAGLVVFLLLFFVVKFLLSILFGMRIILLDAFAVYVMMISSLIIQSIAWFKLTASKLPVAKTLTLPSSAELELLRDYVQDRQIYLEDNLTLELLSKKMGIPVNRLTELFRCHYKKTFKDVIGEFRIREAQRIINLDLKKGEINLMAVALESGFNNKVSFYRIFKKKTGQSPSEYVKSSKSRMGIKC